MATQPGILRSDFLHQRDVGGRPAHHDLAHTGEVVFREIGVIQQCDHHRGNNV